MLKLKLGARDDRDIVIENALTDANAKDFFLPRVSGRGGEWFPLPRNNVAGEVRFFNQAGYVQPIQACLQSEWHPQSNSTQTLAVDTTKRSRFGSSDKHCRFRRMVRRHQLEVIVYPQLSRPHTSDSHRTAQYSARRIRTSTLRSRTSLRKRTNSR